MQITVSVTPEELDEMDLTPHELSERIIDRLDEKSPDFVSYNIVLEIV